MAEYYDYLLGLIPLAFASLTGLLVLFGIGLTTAVPLAHSPRSDSSFTGYSSMAQLMSLPLSLPPNGLSRSPPLTNAPNRCFCFLR